MSEQSTEEIRDLAAAIIAALDVPMAATAADDRAAASLMRSRAAFVRGALTTVSLHGVPPRFAAAAIREEIEREPVAYEPFVQPEESAVGVAGLPVAWSAGAA